MFTDISFSDLLFIQNLQWWSNWEIGLFNRNAQWILVLRLLGIDFLRNKIGAWTSISAHFHRHSAIFHWYEGRTK